MSASAASNQTITTAVTTLFSANSDGGPCTVFAIACISGQPILVNVEGCHKVGEYYRINAGSKEYFRVNHNGIGRVTAKAESATSVIDYGVISKVDAV
jgi:hypothetical protein